MVHCEALQKVQQNSEEYCNEVIITISITSYLCIAHYRDSYKQPWVVLKHFVFHCSNINQARFLMSISVHIDYCS